MPILDLKFDAGDKDRPVEVALNFTHTPTVSVGAIVRKAARRMADQYDCEVPDDGRDSRRSRLTCICPKTFGVQPWPGGSTGATVERMGSVGLRALRQEASELVRRVEGGEEIEITVSGRIAARMVPAGPKRWQRWDDIADAFAGRPDPQWESDRNLIDQSVTNPWERVR